MKKSLSLILAIAMVFSMFASVAFAAEATLDAQAKFDALKAKGIFEGYADGSAGLDREMTRAEYTAVIVRLLGLPKNSSSASYTDTVNHWAQKDGYIEAVTKAGIMEGVGDGKFDAEGKVTLEQLATIMVRALNLQPKANASVAGTSDWAKGYVAAALEAGLISNQTDFTIPAKRDALVSSTYVAEQKKPVAPSTNGKVGVAELKATGVTQLTVKLNGAVDTAKAKLEVKRNDAAQTVSAVKWSDDKTTATITLANKILEGTYTVTLSGIDNLDANMKSAQVATTNEEISKIEFLNASDTLPRNSKVKVEFQALNQYGEKAHMNATQFTIKSSGPTFTTISGEQAIEVDLTAKTAGGSYLYDTNDRVSITIVHEDSGVTASKVFVIGSDPIVSKIEIGDLVDESNKPLKALDTNKTGYLLIVAYDQFGNKISDKATLNRYATVISSDNDLLIGGKDGDKNNPFTDDIDSDKLYDLKLYTNDKLQAGDYTITIFTAGQSASKTVKVAASEQPATVEFGAVDINLAEGDGKDPAADSTMATYKKYIPLIVKNADGGVLSADDVVTAAKNDKFNIYVTGGSFTLGATATEGIKDSGVYKGMIEIATVDKKGSATIHVQLRDDPNVKAQLTLSAGDVRKPDSVKMTSNNFDKIVPGGKAKFAFQFYDQYGDPFKIDSPTNYRVKLSIEKTSGGTPTHSVEVKTFTARDESGNLVPTTPTAGVGNVSVTGSTYQYATTYEMFDNTLEANVASGTPVASDYGTYKIKAELQQYDTTNGWVSVDDKTKNLEIIDVNATNVNMSYSANVIGGVKEGDRYVVPKSVDFYPNGAADLISGSLLAGLDPSYKFTAATHEYAGKEIRGSAKDGTDKVGIPKPYIMSATSSNPAVAKVVLSKPVTATTSALAFVMGIDTGTADITVTFKTDKGTGSATIPVIVKDNPISVDKIKVKRTSRIVSTTSSVYTDLTTGGAYLWDRGLMDQVVITDKAYGNSFTSNSDGDSEIERHQGVLNLTYTVVEATGANASDVSFAADGKITLAPGVASGASFTIRVMAPSGVVQDFEIGIE